MTVQRLVRQQDGRFQNLAYGRIHDFLAEARMTLTCDNFLCSTGRNVRLQLVKLDRGWTLAQLPWIPTFRCPCPPRRVVAGICNR